jgi:hypothetical protein
LWAGFPSHSDDYPAQNMKRAVQTLPSMHKPRNGTANGRTERFRNSAEGRNRFA